MTNAPESRDEEKESARSGSYIEEHNFTMVGIHEAYIGLETAPLPLSLPSHCWPTLISHWYSIADILKNSSLFRDKLPDKIFLWLNQLAYDKKFTNLNNLALYQRYLK